MSTLYPGAKQTFTNPTITDTLSTANHVGLHSDAQDTIAAIEDTVGTTLGTNVLKNFAVGEFPVRNTGGGATGTLVQTLEGGTFSNPTISDGTSSSTTLTTPKIANGGYIADANGNELIIFTTTASAANEITLTNNSGSLAPILASTGTATHIDLSLLGKGTSVVKLQTRNQSITTNTAPSGVFFQQGWGYIQGDGSSTRLSGTVTFPVAFPNNIFSVLLTWNGNKQNSAPTSITQLTSSTDDLVMWKALAPGLSTFNPEVKANAVLGTINFFGYSWLAIGN